jgi:hypothetical protein
MAALNRNGGTHRTSATSDRFLWNCFTIAAAVPKSGNVLAEFEKVIFVFAQHSVVFQRQLTSRCPSV